MPITLWYHYKMTLVVTYKLLSQQQRKLQVLNVCEEWVFGLDCVGGRPYSGRHCIENV